MIPYGFSELPGAVYWRIVSSIADGSTKQSHIADRLGIDRGNCKRYMDDLESVYVIGRRSPMLGASEQPSYRIRDGLVDFQYSVIRRNQTLIDGFGTPEERYREIENEVRTFIGRRFEFLCADWLVRNCPVKRMGTWWGRSEGVDVDIDLVADVRDDSGFMYTILMECEFRKELTGFDTFNRLVKRSKDAHADRNTRLMLISMSGFIDELTDHAKDNGIILVGPKDIFTIYGLPE